jgi:hypothetical protein
MDRRATGTLGAAESMLQVTKFALRSPKSFQAQGIINELHLTFPKSEYDSLRSALKGYLTSRGHLDHQVLLTVLKIFKVGSGVFIRCCATWSSIYSSHSDIITLISGFYKQMLATDALSGKR